MEELKQKVVAEIEAHLSELVSLSLRLYGDPEVGFHEVRAVERLTAFLEGKGFKVERGVYQLPTAFVARYGTGRPVIGFIAEYDALPGLGHACGHNIIAATALGAALGARLAVGAGKGCIEVVGTPAEELYGGKAIMVGRGAFRELDVAMMVHPGSRDHAISKALACIGLEVEFFGKAAHAAARPHEGVNALEAMILAFNAINSLRQHIKDRSRLHGIITKGGEAANIVPAYSSGSFLVRAEEEDYLEELKGKVLACFQGAAQATGARLEYRWADVKYAPLRTNLALARLFAANVATLGRQVSLDESNWGLGSTDMGNVSQIVPSIHPSLAIAPRGVPTHSVEFGRAAASEAAFKALADGAKSLAMTAVDLLKRPEALAQVREEFQKGDEGKA